MSVDVIIVNYNEGRFFAEYFQFVLAVQTRHFFVAGNDSHDGSLAHFSCKRFNNPIFP